ncbi:MAG: AraC family transcriptional regulator [Anaerolineae bacterium]|nr:AraC family transcriptional regulator [Anaerolineae bacterium]
MSAIFEGRPSDSPYVEYIWRGRGERDYQPVCPADVRWNLLFMRRNGQVRVTAEGATTQYVPKDQFEGTEFLVIKFRLGTYLPYLPPQNFLNDDAELPEAAGRSFWLNSFAWQFPDFENVESFVERLVREDLLITDPVVKDVLDDRLPETSSRTVRRRFLRSTGLTYGAIQQIERAKEAAALLQNGVPILDVVDEMGYADQPHLTRSLRRFVGTTPGQIAYADALA